MNRPASAPPGARVGALLTIVAGAAFLAAAAAGAVGLAAIDYDFDERFGEAIWEILRAAGPAAFALVMGIVLSTGRGWARWVLAAGLASGSAWALIRDEPTRAAVPVVLVFAVTWGLGAAALVLSPGISVALAQRREQWYEDVLGPLESATDLGRWVRTVNEWSRGQLVGAAERRRIAAVIDGVLDRGALRDDEEARRVRASLT